MTNRSFAFVVSSLLSAFLYAALVFAIYDSLGLKTLGVNPIIFAAVGIVSIVVFAASYAYKGRSAIIAAAVLIIVLGVIFNSHFKYGLNIMLDEIALLRTEKTGLIQARFDRGTSESISIMVFSAFISVLLAALATVIAFEGKKWSAWIVPIIVVPALALGIAIPSFSVVLLLLVLVLVAIEKHFMDGDVFSKIESLPQSIFSGVLAVALSLSLVLLCSGGMTKNNAGIKAFVEEKIHRFRYEKNELPLPEGNLINVRAFEPTGRTSLIITMTNPETTYLRGFVGEQYSDGRWTRLPEKFYRENSNLFYWLHNDGFFVQSQNAKAHSLIRGAMSGKMDIINVSACKKYVYMPYGLYQNGIRVTDEKLIGDATVYSDGKSVETSIEYIPGTVYQSYVVQQKASQTQSETEELRLYLDNESQYRELAYKYYLAVPDSVEEVLTGLLGERGTLSYSEAKNKVLECLDSNVIYRADVESNRNSEIVEWFLTNRRAGYSVHYAAATTMMLRHLGIPARYVEGYLITPEVASTIEPESRFDISEKMSHAWAEYYLDGVGWIPFETTPGYRNSTMYAPGSEVMAVEGEFYENEGSTNSMEGVDIQEDHPVNDDAPFDNPINDWVRIFAFRKIIIPILILLILLISTTIVLIKRHRLKKFLATMNTGDVRNGIVNSFAYSSLIISKLVPEMNPTFPRDTRDKVGVMINDSLLYDEVLEIRDIACFSSKALPRDSLEKVLAFKDLVLDRYKGTRNVFLRLYDRLVLCIY